MLSASLYGELLSDWSQGILGSHDFVRGHSHVLKRPKYSTVQPKANKMRSISLKWPVEFHKILRRILVLDRFDRLFPEQQYNSIQNQHRVIFQKCGNHSKMMNV